MTEKNNQEEMSLTDELTAVLEEIVDESVEEKEMEKPAFLPISESEFMLVNRQYRLVSNYREGFDAEKLVERYSEVLARYDYVVGDWGYEQLRLKGFFSVSNKKALPEQRIDTLQDYLYEYCNFGCAYFVIERVGDRIEETQTKKNYKTRSKNHSKNKGQAHISEKTEQLNDNRPKGKIRTRQEKYSQEKKKSSRSKQSTNMKKEFTIRKREGEN